MPNFLDETGLQALWNKCVSKFAPSAHNHDMANIVSGVLPVNLGGTGANSADGARTNLGITAVNIGAVPAVNNRVSSFGFDSEHELYVTIDGSIYQVPFGCGRDDILTNKSPVTIAQGGTGATDAATALTNLGAAPASHTHYAGTIQPASIEFLPPSTTAGHGGYINFHFNKSTTDFTSRIIEETSGVLQINGATFSNGVITATKVIGAVYA